MNSTALLIIDLQNDYFDDGKFPLWRACQTKDSILSLIQRAKEQGVIPIHIQHIADPAMGPAPFFNANSAGADIHPDVLAAAPDAPVVTKSFADSFEQTNLGDILRNHGIKRLIITGMMTHNCVTHTALSKMAEQYDIKVVSDATTTVSEILQLIALHALSPRVTLTDSASAFN